ncbi:hypothetical protein F5Y02DRAFT_266920 [Annulohypoxylon stygium]|nr:hypothetical protein F5Y02DRAFT_266920 [Annulohypoxylon stygium]
MRFATTFRDTVSTLKQLFPLLLLLFRGLYASYEAIKSIKTKFLNHIPMSLSDLASHTQAMPTVQRQDLIRVPPSSNSDEARGDTNAPAPTSSALLALYICYSGRIRGPTYRDMDLPRQRASM